MNDSSTSDHPRWDVHGRLEDPMARLAIALGQWARRDDSKPQPEIRQAANTAMDSIDSMLRELHALRARLMGEIRVSDDATTARAEALLKATDTLLGDLNRPARDLTVRSDDSTGRPEDIGRLADPLVRRQQFEAGHPDVTISAPETHASMWTARQDGKILATDYQLGGLLDALDWLLP